jgi:hypothetical protein
MKVNWNKVGGVIAGGSGVALLILTGKPYVMGKFKNEGPDVVVVSDMPNHSKHRRPGGSPSDLHLVKAGEWSEWEFVVGYAIRAIPKDADIPCQVKNIKGEVRDEPKLAAWDDAVFVRIRPKDVDALYTISEW